MFTWFTVPRLHSALFLLSIRRGSSAVLQNLSGVKLFWFYLKSLSRAVRQAVLQNHLGENLYWSLKSVSLFYRTSQV